MPKTSRLAGKVVAHNLSPRGELEGLLLETKGGIVQVNYPKHGGEVSARKGERVELDVVDHDAKGDHDVYELAPEDKPIAGKVVRFNFSRHGEVNGYHLDSGEMVHVKPDGARRSKVAVGDAIEAEGERRTGRDGVVVDTDKVKKAKRAR